MKHPAAGIDDEGFQIRHAHLDPCPGRPAGQPLFGDCRRGSGHLLRETRQSCRRFRLFAAPAPVARDLRVRFAVVQPPVLVRSLESRLALRRQQAHPGGFRHRREVLVARGGRSRGLLWPASGAASPRQFARTCPLLRQTGAFRGRLWISADLSPLVCDLLLPIARVFGRTCSETEAGAEPPRREPGRPDPQGPARPRLDGPVGGRVRRALVRPPRRRRHLAPPGAGGPGLEGPDRRQDREARGGRPARRDRRGRRRRDGRPGRPGRRDGRGRGPGDPEAGDRRLPPGKGPGHHRHADAQQHGDLEPADPGRGQRRVQRRARRHRRGDALGRDGRRPVPGPRPVIPPADRPRRGRAGRGSDGTPREPPWCRPGRSPGARSAPRAPAGPRGRSPKAA